MIGSVRLSVCPFVCVHSEKFKMNRILVLRVCLFDYYQSKIFVCVCNLEPLAGKFADVVDQLLIE